MAVKTILHKELHSHLTTFRFIAGVVAAVALVMISVAVLGNDYELRLRSYERLADEHALDSLEVKVPSRLEPVLLRPPSPLGVFAAGAERRIGDMVRVFRWTVPAEAEDSYASAEVLNAVQSFDLLTIFTFVASLFGVLLSYDTICGEKDSGTLKMMSVTGASLAAVYGAKFVAATIAVALPFVIAMLLAPLGLNLLFGVQFAWTHLMAIGVMTASLVAYIAAFVAVGMLCSCLMARPSTSLVLSLLCWTVVVFVLPVAIQNLVATFHPAPDPTEISVMIQESFDETSERTAELYYQHVSQSGGRFGQWSALNEGTWLFDAGPEIFLGLEELVRQKERIWQERADRIWNVIREQQRQHEAQARLLDMVSIVSPAYQFRSSVTAAAGTDYGSLERFLEASRRFRQALLTEYRNRGYFGENAVELFSRMPKGKAHSHEDYKRRLAEYRRMIDEGTFGMETIDFRNFPPMKEKLVPPFDFEATPLNFDRALVGLLMLAAWVALLYALGFVLCQRYDIR